MSCISCCHWPIKVQWLARSERKRSPCAFVEVGLDVIDCCCICDAMTRPQIDVDEFGHHATNAYELVHTGL